MTLALRTRLVNDAPMREHADYVLYWMIAARRPHDNYALARAVEVARERDLPLVVLEALRAGYTWASDRLHTFVLEGMADNARYFAKKPVTYHAYVEPEHGAGSGLLEALAKHAALVVTDEFPCFFLPHMIEAAGGKLDVRLEAIDSCGVLPLSLAAGRSYPTAYAFRRFVQTHVLDALAASPPDEPLRRVKLKTLGALPKTITKRWPGTPVATLAAPARLIATLPIDHDVPAVDVMHGGFHAAHARLEAFIAHALPRYGEERSDPDAHAASGLSPWLHFGHIGAQRVVRAVAEAARWDGHAHIAKPNGKRAGFWGMNESAEAFLDELITWRELAYNTAHTLPHYDQYRTLPEWAKKSLDEHTKDERPARYDLRALESANTYDPVWNAAQRELVRDGRMQNYMRMLWGKKILEWSKTPEVALKHALHLNNKYAIDGRDPNSVSGVFWVFGRYDRPWAPKRPIFGVIRYMSSDAAKRKLALKEYLARFADVTPAS